MEEGWYGRRKVVQLYFIIAVALFCGWAAVTLLVWARHSPLPTWLALVGTTSIIGYVLIRAASFHHIDRLIGSPLGFRWNWILEMGGISVVLLASSGDSIKLNNRLPHETARQSILKQQAQIHSERPPRGGLSVVCSR